MKRRTVADSTRPLPSWHSRRLKFTSEAGSSAWRCKQMAQLAKDRVNDYCTYCSDRGNPKRTSEPNQVWRPILTKVMEILPDCQRCFRRSKSCHSKLWWWKCRPHSQNCQRNDVEVGGHTLGGYNDLPGIFSPTKEDVDSSSPVEPRRK